MLIYAVLAAPLAAAAAAAALPWRPWTGWAAAAANAAVLVLGIMLAVQATRRQLPAVAGGVLRADALSAFMVVVIGAIAVLASGQSVRYLGAEIGRGACTTRHATLYTTLVQVFVTCMLAAVLAANLGVMWVAVEATTIATTFLVGHRRTGGALEASWKYMVICSTGIALAFLGTVLFYFAALHASGHPAGSLDWTSLMAAARRLDPGVVRLAMGLLVLGYGTKVGLAPMHSWLPDAHSQAPAPVSALMSGVLLTVAFYALLRFKAIADTALGPGYPRALLVAAGLASLAVAASLLLSQRDYKRMLAYHSVEHMGLIALGAAAGSTLAIAAVLLHILGHGLAKGVLFLASGEILLAEGTSEIAKVPALLSRRPVLGGIFGFGLVALLGLPPFSLFASELGMIRAEFAAGLGWAAALALACMAVIFAAVMAHGRHLLLGEAPTQRPQGAQGPQGPQGTQGRRGATPRAVAVPLGVGLLTCAFLGVSAWPIQPLLHAAAQVVS
jgi:hydrogenase-4 component F